MGADATLVVVGAGLAAARAVQTMREEGFDGRIVLLGDEPVPPYDRVSLSKQHLRGESGGHQLFVHAQDYYAANDIELRLDTSVAAVDTTARRVELASGEPLGYDALLLATGAEARRLHGPGADLDGICYLRSLADADLLRDAIQGAGRVVIVGAGWIGCEVAASARELGADVALIDRASLPLEAQLGPEMAEFYHDLHADHGVALHLGLGVDEFRGASAVEEVVLSSGQVLPADVVVVGIGAAPRVALAEAAGLAIHNGIVTDEYLASSVPGVFAAGDVANVWQPALRRRLRLEHWSAALNQGPIAARNMLGQTTPYQRIPFFFSDQYGVWMEFTGDATDADRLVVRTLPGERQFIAFWLRDGYVAAAMNVNIRDAAGTLAALIATRRRIDPASLADPDVELTGLLTPGSTVN